MIQKLLYHGILSSLIWSFDTFLAFKNYSWCHSHSEFHLDHPEKAKLQLSNTCLIVLTTNSLLKNVVVHEYPICIQKFLRTARSFYESLLYLLTYLLSYGQINDFWIWKSKWIRQEVILHYFPYFLRYKLENAHGDSLLHFKHFLYYNVFCQSVSSGPIEPPKD